MIIPDDSEIKRIHNMAENKAVILKNLVDSIITEIEMNLIGRIESRYLKSYDKKIDYLIKNWKRLEIPFDKIKWYIDNYLSFLEDENLRRRAFEFLGIENPYGFQPLDVNPGYNRALAAKYAEDHAENPNTLKYPFFAGADCANFISQVLHEGGMAFLGGSWESFNSWFCYTNSVSNLTKISLTWRVARYFRRHWGNENGIGRNRAYNYSEMKVKEAMENFDGLYSFLIEGDVIQYGDPKNYNIPYHTQVIHYKGFNPDIKRNDLFMAQHTRNRKNVSLFKYLKAFKDPEERYVYVYKMKKD